jgi:hypothetical protein
MISTAVAEILNSSLDTYVEYGLIPLAYFFNLSKNQPVVADIWLLIF